MILFIQTLLSGYRIFQRKSKPQSHNFFNIILFTPILITSFSNHVSSLSPDLPIFVLGIVLSARLLEFLENQKRSSRDKEYAVFVIIVMAVLGLTIKMSFIAFGVSAALLVSIVCFLRNGIRFRLNRRRVFICSIACTMILLAPWMARGVLLSGYVFYPSTFASFPVEWRLPRLAAVEEANWIRGWARQPNVHWNEVLGNWDWLKPWAGRTLKDYEVVVPMLLVLIGCVFLFYSRFKKIKKRNSHRIKWLFLLPMIVSLIYWFFTAPALRFVGASFWVLGTGVMILGIENFKSRKILTLCFALLILLSWLVHERKHLGKELWKTKSFPLRYAELEKFKTRSGLIIYVPKKGDQCWNGPLLCTPFPKDNLRLRREGDISRGFILDLKD